MAVNGTHSDPIIRDDTPARNHRELARDSDIDTESSNAHNNECVFIEFGHIGYTARRALHAIHINWHSAQGFRVRRGNVQIIAVPPR